MNREFLANASPSLLFGLTSLISFVCIYPIMLYISKKTQIFGNADCMGECKARKALRKRLPEAQWNVITELEFKALRGALGPTEVAEAYLRCPARHKQAFLEAWGEPIKRNKNKTKAHYAR